MLGLSRIDRATEATLGVVTLRVTIRGELFCLDG